MADALTALQLMDDCANYAVDCYIKSLANSLQLPCPLPVTSEEIPKGFLAELRMLAYRASEAVQNPIELPWDNLTYGTAVGGQNGGNAAFEAALQEGFPPLEPVRVISDPATIVDPRGEAIAWLLPNAITEERQDQIAQTAPLLADALNAHPPKVPDPARAPKDPTAAWRNSEYLFAVEDRPLYFGRGSTTLSPAWMAQGLEGLLDPLYVSRDLAAKPGKADSRRQLSAQAWIGENIELGLLLSSALAITHPEQYYETKQSLAILASHEPHSQHLQTWTFAFNVVTIIANRMTPLHRDRASGARELYDVLFTLGGDRHTTLSLPGLGVRFQYDSGAVALFSGSTHLHHVSPFVMEHLCIACYSRPAVQAKLGRRHPQAPTVAGTMPEGWSEALWRQRNY
ncbi:unnamed protein product [Peniophora sp. CBMAI 1063]|nr:unnamed protein product [Peniophora sp. CBMAI 1063]